MQTLLHELELGMQTEQVSYMTLLELAEKKKDALIHNDVNTVQDILKEEISTLQRIRELNAKQTDTLQAIADMQGMDRLPNLTELISIQKNDEDKQRLLELQRNFQKLVDALRLVNDQNQALLETQLQYTNFFLDLLTQNDTVGDLYGSSGQVAADPTPRRVLFSQEA